MGLSIDLVIVLCFCAMLLILDKFQARGTYLMKVISFVDLMQYIKYQKSIILKFHMNRTIICAYLICKPSFIYQEAGFVQSLPKKNVVMSCKSIMYLVSIFYSQWQLPHYESGEML